MDWFFFNTHISSWWSWRPRRSLDREDKKKGGRWEGVRDSSRKQLISSKIWPQKRQICNDIKMMDPVLEICLVFCELRKWWFCGKSALLWTQTRINHIHTHSYLSQQQCASLPKPCCHSITGLLCNWFQGKKKQKNKKQNICFVLTDLKTGFKRILFSNKDTSVTHMAGKQHKRWREGCTGEKQTQIKAPMVCSGREGGWAGRRSRSRRGHRHSRAWALGGLVSSSNTTSRLISSICASCKRMRRPHHHVKFVLLCRDQQTFSPATELQLGICRG